MKRLADIFIDRFTAAMARMLGWTLGLWLSDYWLLDGAVVNLLTQGG